MVAGHSDHSGYSTAQHRVEGRNCRYKKKVTLADVIRQGRLSRTNLRIHDVPSEESSRNVTHRLQFNIKETATTNQKEGNGEKMISLPYNCTYFQGEQC